MVCEASCYACKRYRSTCNVQLAYRATTRCVPVSLTYAVMLCLLAQGLAGCCLLQQLDASDNQLCTFPADLHLPLLQRLSLCANAFMRWPSFPPLPHLKHLNLADNQLQQLSAMHGLLQLKTLDLSFNRLQDLAACLAALQAAPRLEELHLHDNDFLPLEHQLPGLDPAGLAGAAGADEGLHQQQVTAALPWLVRLDGDEVQPPLTRLAVRARQRHALDQQQQEQRAAGSISRERQAHCRLATGQLIAGSVWVSSRLLHELKAGSVRMLGAALRHMSAADCPQPGAAADMHSVLQAAADWLHCHTCWQLSGSAACLPAASSSPHQAQQQQLTQHWARPAAGAAAAPNQALQAANNRGSGGRCTDVLPCVHLQQTLLCTNSSSSCGFCHGHGWSRCFKAECNQCGTRSSSSSTCCACPAWLQQVEAVWCYSTRAWVVDQQATQLAAKPPAAPDTALQHLLQLQQACCVHQQQVVECPGFGKARVDQVTAAAVQLQSMWRARAAWLWYRQCLQQERRQQSLVEASVALQSLWRGRQCRHLLAEKVQLQTQIAPTTAAAAAVKIQAAIRGHKVRQRLRAALGVARAGAETCTTREGRLSQQQVANGSTAAAASEDDLEFEGVSEGFVCLQEDLLSDLLLAGAAYDDPIAITEPLQQQHQQSLVPANGAMAFYPAANAGGLQQNRQHPSRVHAAPGAHELMLDMGVAAAPAEPAADDAAYTPTSGKDGGCATHGSSCQVEARITALMAEWGFEDRATAEAYYR